MIQPGKWWVVAGCRLPGDPCRQCRPLPPDLGRRFLHSGKLHQLRTDCLELQGQVLGIRQLHTQLRVLLQQTGSLLPELMHIGRSGFDRAISPPPISSRSGNSGTRLSPSSVTGSTQPIDHTSLAGQLTITAVNVLNQHIGLPTVV